VAVPRNEDQWWWKIVLLRGAEPDQILILQEDFAHAFLLSGVIMLNNCPYIAVYAQYIGKVA